MKFALVAAVGLSGSLAAQSQVFDFRDPDQPVLPADYADSVAAAGDVNADGFADVIVSDRGLHFGVVRVYSGRDGKLIYEISGSDRTFGQALGGGADLNQDGYEDFLIGEPEACIDLGGASCTTNVGRVWVFSGKDRSVLQEHRGTFFFERLGTSVAFAGDVNNDGVVDIIAGGPTTANGRVKVFSGADGTTLYDFVEGTNSNHGRVVASFGDQDGDGFDDFLVSAPNFFSDRGAVRLYSGLDRGMIFEFLGLPGEQIGNSLAAGDINDDGIPDVIIGSVLGGIDPVSGNSTGRADVYSGANGTLIHTVFGDALFDRLGSAVDYMGDINDDNYGDFMVASSGSDTAGPNAGRVRIYSGLDASVLVEYLGSGPVQNLGRDAANAGDVNADGLPDVVLSGGGQSIVVIDDEPISFVEQGVAQVRTIADVALSADRHDLDIVAGDSLNLTLNAGLERAGDVYWIFGSGTGTTPGVDFGGGIVLPLNYDSYFRITLRQPNAAIFDSFLGVLDANGQASAALNLPPGGDPGLLGLTLHHAYLTAETLGSANFASNPTPTVLASPLIPQTLTESFESGLAFEWTVSEIDFAPSLAEPGDCGAITRMLAFTDQPGTCAYDDQRYTVHTPIVRVDLDSTVTVSFDYIFDVSTPADVFVSLYYPPNVFPGVEVLEGLTQTLLQTGNLEHFSKTVSVPATGIGGVQVEISFNPTSAGTGAGFMLDNLVIE